MILLRLMISFLLMINMAEAQGDRPQTVVAEGLARIFRGDISAAADRAVNDALRKAVQQSMGLYIDAQTIVQHNQLISDRILARTRGYVTNYRITGRRRVDQNHYAVVISAEVHQSQLRDDLAAAGLIYAGKRYPRLMIIPSQGAVNNVFFSSLSAALSQRLMSRGIDLVDNHTASAYYTRSGRLQQVGGNTAAIRTAALRQGADVLVILDGKTGSARQAPAAMLSAGLNVFHGSITLKAVQADDGRIIASASADGKATHFDEISGGQKALTSAVESAADQLAAKLLAAWRDDIYQSQTISIQIDGLAAYRDLLNIIARLKGLRSVQEVIERDYLLGQAAIELKSTTDAGSIAGEIISFDFAPYTVEIIARGANTLTLRVSGRK